MKKVELVKKNDRKNRMVVQTLSCHCGCGGKLFPAAQHQWTTGGSNSAIG